MDREAIVKTLALLNTEIETLERAKKELLGQLEKEISPTSKKKLPRGSLKKFIDRTIMEHGPLTEDELMESAMRENPSIKRPSLVVALGRGIKKGDYGRNDEGYFMCDKNVDKELFSPDHEREKIEHET